MPGWPGFPQENPADLRGRSTGPITQISLPQISLRTDVRSATLIKTALIWWSAITWQDSETKILILRVQGNSHKADQDEAAVTLSDHQRATAVPLAGVLPSRPVAGTQHLRVEADGDAGPAVPRLALPVINQRNVHHLQHLGPFLLLGHEEGERPQLIVGDDGTPACRVRHGSRLRVVTAALRAAGAARRSPLGPAQPAAGRSGRCGRGS